MQHFDSDYAERLCARIEAISVDQKPLWGRLDRQGLLEHFIWVLRHAMGRSSRVPDYGTWFARRILKPLVLAGIVRIPEISNCPNN